MLVGSCAVLLFLLQTVFNQDLQIKLYFDVDYNLFHYILDAGQGATPAAQQVQHVWATAAAEIIIEADIHIQPHELDDLHEGMSN